jgi:hypothetical protein
MATAAFGVVWIWVLALSGAGSAPAAGPPLPLDPKLSAIAPEECLWYASSAGVTAADAGSSNETERLFAEPQVQRFIEGLESQVITIARSQAGEAPDQKVLAAKIPILIKALLTRPMAIYANKFTPKENGADVEGALVLSAGDSREEIAGAIKTLITLAVERGAPAFASETVGGVDWQRLPTPPEAPQVQFGWKDDYFIVAVGKETPALVTERMGGAAPKWLAEIRAEHPIEREKSLGYLNIAGILETVRPMIEADEPEAWDVLTKLGIVNIRSLHGITGYDKEGCTGIGHLVTDGERAGLLAFIPHEPLTTDDLAMVPKDATIALACRLNPAEVVKQAVELASQFEPEAEAEFEGDMAQIEVRLGVNVRDDILGALGDGWTLYLPGGDIMSSWLNTAGAVGVKDASKLRPAIAKLIELAKMQLQQEGGQAAVNESTVGDHTIYTLQIFGAPVPISPSLCITEKWAVIGLTSQAVQASLARSPADSLSTVDAVKRQFGGDDVPSALVYQDTPQLVKSLYPWLQMGLQMVTAQLAQQGVQIDPSILPPAEVIVKHLRPSVTTLTRVNDGFEFATRGSFPGAGNLAASAPIGAALLLPAIGSARQAARNAQEMNTLKMLGLAALNTHDALGKMPSDIYSDDGKPLLSWRVRVLPFIEEQALYNQFHLDEPWDSEHNRPLIDQMPAFLASPSGGEAGKTRFLAFKGAATMFPGGEGVRLQEVTDGTSNTLLFVQAAPEAAVEWTKPADLEYDAAAPFAGVATPDGQFLAVFSDGAARSISLGIGAEAMNGLVTRNGDEAVDQNVWMTPPAPHLYEGPGSVLAPADGYRPK